MNDSAASTLIAFSERIYAMEQEIRDLIHEEANTHIKKAFTELFNNHPVIEAIRWTQYTPYFNDGDACYFSVYDLTVKFKDLDGPDNEDYIDGFYDSWSLEYYSDKGRFVLTDKMREGMDSVREIEGALHSMSDALEISFGDHAMITVTRSGIDVEEYDHD